MARKKKAEGTNLSLYRIFDGKRYKLHAEYPRFHSGIIEDAEKLRRRGYLVRKVRTAYGFALYKRKKQ